MHNPDSLLLGSLMILVQDMPHPDDLTYAKVQAVKAMMLACTAFHAVICSLEHQKHTHQLRQAAEYRHWRLLFWCPPRSAARLCASNAGYVSYCKEFPDLPVTSQ